jgi:hypothetical protein
MKSALVVCAALALIRPVLPIAAQSARTPIDVAKLGPQVGERVPDFRLVDQSGQMQTLRSIMGSKGAMLLFYRSADW